MQPFGGKPSRETLDCQASEQVGGSARSTGKTSPSPRPARHRRRQPTRHSSRRYLLAAAVGALSGRCRPSV